MEASHGEYRHRRGQGSSIAREGGPQTLPERLRSPLHSLQQQPLSAEVRDHFARHQLDVLVAPLRREPRGNRPREEAGELVVLDEALDDLAGAIRCRDEATVRLEVGPRRSRRKEGEAPRRPPISRRGSPDRPCAGAPRATSAPDRASRAGTSARRRSRASPGSPPRRSTSRLNSSTDSELGQLAEARAAAAEVLRINPQFSLAIHEQREPIKDPAVLERHLVALRKAGLK